MGQVRKLVRPTRREANDGERESAVSCPYARAARRVLRRTLGVEVVVTVNVSTIRWWTATGDQRGGVRTLAYPVRRRINLFDSTEDRTSPWPGFYITIEVPESKEAEP